MILGIESSCDESALALFDPAKGLAGEWVHSQIDLHGEYGGVVPDLASREHLDNFPRLLAAIRRDAEDLCAETVAVTYGPGLAGCLAIGIAMAKGLALAWDARLVGVNHLRAHAFSPFIGMHAEHPDEFAERLRELLPHLGLLVSGGNTLLFDIGADLGLEVIARTEDDAAGEALDKGAKLLGLGYPGGPLIERQARAGDPAAFAFPRAFYEAPDLRFSFSGLKTSLRYRIEEFEDTALADAMPDLCASYQEAIVDALARKTRQAFAARSYASIGLSGGVANNSRLQTAFQQVSENEGVPLFVARPEHTGDNAAMVAFAAFTDPQGLIEPENFELSIHPSLKLA